MSKNGQQPRKIRAKVLKKKLQRQQVRERAKVARHVVNLQQLSDADQNPAILELRRQCEENRRGYNEIIGAFNKNFRTYTDAIQHMDARLGALMLVANDITEVLRSRGLLDETILTTVGVATKDENGVNVTRQQPFWEGYISSYVNLLKLAEKQSKQDSTPLVESVPDESDSDYADTTFGGEDMPHVEISAGGAASAPG
jgi:hypothetical protein